MNKFVNRNRETDRLERALSTSHAVLIVVYGRRRCGKSTLLRHLLTDNDIYFAADKREPSLQIEAFAKRIDQIVPGFSAVTYPSWEVLFRNLENTLKVKTTVCIDEFPYLVKNSPGLPSVLQNIVDQKLHNMFNIVLCGSSQQMMHSMTLDSASPLYGRSDEILKIKPMNVAYLKEYLGVSNEESVEEFGVWGGVPRYWEIRKSFKSLEEAVKYQLINPDGILYEEPARLFLDEMRTSMHAESVLSLIGGGSHRISEIGGRLGKPATQLSRILGLLIDLGYVRRELPFGESLKSTKKSLYKIADPFMNFYYTFVLPNKSMLEYELIGQVWDKIADRFNRYISFIWEDICLRAVPCLSINNKTFGAASRWWGNGLDGIPMEIDIVAESTDKKTLLIGEVKWSDKVRINEVYDKLSVKSNNIPFLKNRKIIKVLFVKKAPRSIPDDIMIFTPNEVLGVLK
jgi:AAA+ ATPase superfamily predicted ATPase